MRSWHLARRAFPFVVVTAVASAALVATPDATSPVVDAAGTPAVLHETTVPLVPEPSAEEPDAPEPAESDAPAPTARASQDEAQADPDVSTQDVEETDGDDGTDVVAHLDRSDVEPYSMVGVTWASGGEDYDVRVSWRTDGTWSEPEALEVEVGDSAEEGRAGTEPRWVGEADGVEVTVSSPSGERPEDLKVATVDPGETPDAAPVAASVDRPAIIPRSSWGAAPVGATECSSPRTASKSLGAVLHHTAGSNSYSKAQSPGIVRAAQSYHRSRGWCDIGYNFLVDKYGQIFEGRRGGMTKQVRGAHAGVDAVNRLTMGVSMMGTYVDVEPTVETRRAVADLIAWRFAQDGIPATGTVTVGSQRIQRISGHRDVKATECPGRVAYAWLIRSGNSGLRGAVANRMAGRVDSPAPTPSSTHIANLAKKIGSSALGKVVRSEWGSETRRRADYANMNLYWTSEVGSAHSVGSVYRTEYDRLKQQKGVLGFPTSQVEDTSRSNVSIQRFQTGSIYRVDGKKAHALYGGIWEEYVRKSQTKGDIGVPTSSVYVPREGYQRADFTNAAIELNTATGEITHWYTDGGARPALVVPDKRTVTFTGHGFGHGIGMSQNGAQGQAIAGRTFRQILSTYYPGTTLTTRSGRIRVLLSQPTSSTLTVKAKKGLVLRYVSSNRTKALKTSTGGKAISAWRVVVASSERTKSVLQYKVGSTWKTSGDRFSGDAQFEAMQSTIGLVLPGGAVKTYRSILRSAKPSKTATTRRTVNITNYDSYIQGVVPSEMPSSWRPEALKAQAVAARTYAIRSLDTSRYYDVCDTTACQVYKGVAAEASSTNAAVAATKGRILTYQGKPALTQYSASSGGQTAKGSQPYLKSVKDSWDGWSGNPNHTWKTSISAATIERTYPTIGTLRSVKIVSRESAGTWGGRAGSVVFQGSKGSRTVSGPDVRFAFGLKSHYFRLG